MTDFSSPPLSFRMVAGEASGDLLAALLLKGMNQRWGNLDLAGIGGEKMQQQGFNCWSSYQKLSIHGYVDAIKNYRELSALRNATAQRIIADQPNAFIGIDAPDFNLGLAKKVKQAGIKSIHFVSPSIWAWRGWRIKSIKESVDLVLCLFPFEPAIYEKAGVAASYVGHPLADEITLTVSKTRAREELGINSSNMDALIALMPGSRRSEVMQLTPTYLSAAQELLKHRPHLRFVLPVAPNVMPLVKPMVEQYQLGDALTLLDGQADLALAACDVAIIASGTATLEAALYKRPMVIAYRVGALSAFLYRRMAYLPWVGLPNILCHETLVPERLQEQMNAKQLCADVLDWLDSPQKVERLESRFTELHQLLRCNTAHAATHAIAQIL